MYVCIQNASYISSHQKKASYIHCVAIVYISIYIPMHGSIKGSHWMITKISLGDKLSPSGQKFSPSRCVSRRNMVVIAGT